MSGGAVPCGSSGPVRRSSDRHHQQVTRSRSKFSIRSVRISERDGRWKNTASLNRSPGTSTWSKTSPQGNGPPLARSMVIGSRSPLHARSAATPAITASGQSSRHAETQVVCKRLGEIRKPTGPRAAIWPRSSGVGSVGECTHNLPSGSRTMVMRRAERQAEAEIAHADLRAVDDPQVLGDRLQPVDRLVGSQTGPGRHLSPSGQRRRVRHAATPVPKSDPKPCFVRVAGVKPCEAPAEGGLGLTPATRTRARSKIGWTPGQRVAGRVEDWPHERTITGRW